MVLYQTEAAGLVVKDLAAARELTEMVHRRKRLTDDLLRRRA
jgi:ribosomal protein S15P/S13E